MAHAYDAHGLLAIASAGRYCGKHARSEPQFSGATRDGDATIALRERAPRTSSHGAACADLPGRLKIDLTPLRTLARLPVRAGAGRCSTSVRWSATSHCRTRSTTSPARTSPSARWASIELVPLIVFGLYGGALADHVDRRTMLVITGCRPGGADRVAAAQRDGGPAQVWMIYVVGGLLSVAYALQRPSRDALLPRVVAARGTAGRVALSSLSMQVGMLRRPGDRRRDRRQRSASRGPTPSTSSAWSLATVLFARPPCATRRTRRRAAEPGRDQGRAAVRGRSARPARHVRRRHGRHVHGDADRAVPGVRDRGAQRADSARTPLLRRGGRQHGRDGHERLDGPGSSPRPSRGDRDDGVGSGHRGGRPGADACGSRLPSWRSPAART